MENEFQAEICGGSWWNPARSMFGSSPCSSEFGIWSSDNFLDMKTTRSGDESDGSSIVIQDHHHWNNPANLFHGRSETTNYPPILQEHRNSSRNYGQEPGVLDPIIQKDWTLKNFSDHQDFALEVQKPLNSSTGFPISSVSYDYSSTLLQTLFDPDPQPQQQSLYGNGLSMNYPTNNSTNYLPKISPLTNTTIFCNTSAAPTNNFRPNLMASNEELQGLGTVAKKSSCSEPAFKRPRIETPSPLPTFKVRKEKLGDRITALQQLVSPFGKTDTASVLHEAIDYIKFLHDQLSVLSTPYLRNGSPIQQRQQTCDIKTKDQEGAKQDLKSRGLCLVPISSTFPVAAETTSDFWTPTFGGTFS